MSNKFKSAADRLGALDRRIAAKQRKEQAKSDTRVWDRIKKDVMKSGEPYIKVGVLATQGGNEPHSENSPITMVELAAIHEFGSPAANIPERSFIRRTMREKQEQIKKMFAAAAKGMIERRLTYQKSCALIGTFLATSVKNRITQEQHIPPPLQPKTIERKGSDRPLVDTGRLVGAITYEVVEGEG